MFSLRLFKVQRVMKIIEPRQSVTALEITRKRYLMTDSKGRVVETVGEMLWRVSQHMAKPEIIWSDNGAVKQAAANFYSADRSRTDARKMSGETPDETSSGVAND